MFSSRTYTWRESNSLCPTMLVAHMEEVICSCLPWSLLSAPLFRDKKLFFYSNRLTLSSFSVMDGTECSLISFCPLSPVLSVPVSSEKNTPNPFNMLLPLHLFHFLIRTNFLGSHLLYLPSHPFPVNTRRNKTLFSCFSSLLTGGRWFVQASPSHPP